MNGLSTEVKAKETHEKAVGYFKVSEQYGYKFIMEVKKIRDDRYYKELGFNTFEDYCQNAWGFSRRWVDMKIQSASKLNESDFEKYTSQIGNQKTFLLATMEDEQREQATKKGIPTNEGYKPIDEATQQEINEYRRNADEAERKAKEYEQRAKQAEQQAEIERKERERVERENQELANKEPKVIEKEIVKEVDKTDYEKVRQLEKQLEKARRERQRAIEESDKNIEALENYMNSYVKPEQEKKSRIVAFTNDLSVGVSNLASNIEKAKQRLDGTINNDEQVIKSIERAIESLKDYIITLDEMKGGDVIEIN